MVYSVLDSGYPRSFQRGSRGSATISFQSSFATCSLVPSCTLWQSYGTAVKKAPGQDLGIQRRKMWHRLVKMRTWSAALTRKIKWPRMQYACWCVTPVTHLLQHSAFLVSVITFPEQYLFSNNLRKENVILLYHLVCNLASNVAIYTTLTNTDGQLWCTSVLPSGLQPHRYIQGLLTFWELTWQVMQWKQEDTFQMPWNQW